MMHPSVGGDDAANGVLTSERLSTERDFVDAVMGMFSARLPTGSTIQQILQLSALGST